MYVRFLLESLGQEDLLGRAGLAWEGLILKKPLKWMLKESVGRLWVRLSWLKIGNSCGLVWTR
jgi:hypothetical protein